MKKGEAVVSGMRRKERVGRRKVRELLGWVVKREEMRELVRR